MTAFQQLSDQIQNHIRQICKTSGLPQSDESLEQLAAAWLEKNKLFDEATAEQNMEQLSFYDKDESRGALILTWSGSLLTLGPLVDGKRRCEYQSVGLRTDVPQAAVHEAAVLASDLEADAIVSFSVGPIQQSSPVYRIAIQSEKLPTDQAEKLLTAINQNLAEDFVEVNKTVMR